MADRIDTVSGRERLKPRCSAYWHKLSSGCHLGFRKMTKDSTGAWLAQAYDPDTRKQTRRSLGSFDALPDHLRFDAAKREAETWFKHLDRGGTTEDVTVATAAERYVAHVRHEKGEDQADDIEGRFRRWLYNDPLASVSLHKLKRHQIEEWRRTVAQTPVVSNPFAESPDVRERSASSVNRDMTPLRAALNFAQRRGLVTSNIAWLEALRPMKNADGRRDVYLDRTQRRALLAQAPADLALFLRGLSLMPLRPGALAALAVANYDRRIGVLTIGKDKAGRDRKIKLPEATAAFFAERTTDKLPAAPLFCRADGLPWDKDYWKKPLKAAALAAKLPDETTAYALRHSVITDLVTGGLDLLTVAQLSGTGVQMIERHYGHLRKEHAAAALATLAL